VELLLINIGMILSLGLFYLGYYFRNKSNFTHRVFNLIGISLNLITAIYLLAGKYLMGGIESMNIFPIVPIWVVNVHRLFAFICLLLMLYMGFSGVTKRVKSHKKLGFSFLVLYTIIVLSGLIIFKSGTAE
jgi:hypothetical protein